MDKWFVSRQCYWGVEEGEDLVVEIAYGGTDYANPDMLSDPGGIYGKLGSCKEYSDPREALTAALAVREEWQKQEKDTIRIEHGYTGGMTMPFMSFPDDEELKKWAADEWEKLPKCDICGEVRHETYRLCEDPLAGEFCSELCAEKAWRSTADLCDQCGEVLEDEPYRLYHHPDLKFCDVECAEDFCDGEEIAMPEVQHEDLR